MYRFTTSYSLTGVKSRDSRGQLDLGGTNRVTALAASSGQQQDPEYEERGSAAPVAGISPPTHLAMHGPSYSPAVTPTDESHPLSISQAKANNQPQAMCQLPLPTAPALLPQPRFPCLLAYWFCHKQGLVVRTRCFSFCIRSSGY